MNGQGKGIVAGGAALLWRRQRVLWWLFAANFAVGFVAAAPVRNQLGFLDSSSEAAGALYHQMNVFRLVEALTRPEGNPRVLFGNSIVLAFVYFGILLFASGGVLEALYTDRPLRFGEFLASSASFFWRMVRLLILFTLMILPIFLAQSAIGPITDWFENRSAAEKINFGIPLALLCLLGLAALAVRVWLDLAQIDCVAHDRRAVRHSLRRARQILRVGFFRVYGSVLAMQLLLIGVTVLLLCLWIKLPHEAVGATFLIGQLVVVLWLGCRLWQKAAEIAWYHARDIEEAPPLSVVAPVEVEIAAPISGSESGSV